MPHLQLDLSEERMAEPITLRTREGASTEGEAEVTRHGDGTRTARAAMFVAAGLIGGAVFIVVPGLHLITTWALPLAGIIAAVYALRTRVVVGRATGPCPGCGEAMALPGGPVEGALWDRCPHCTIPVEIVLRAEVSSGVDEGAS